MVYSPRCVIYRTSLYDNLDQMLSREILPLVITPHIYAVVTARYAEAIKAVPYPFNFSQLQNP